MILPSPELDALETRYVREVFGPMSYREALERFAALWEHALKLDPGFPGDWEADIEVDVDLKRALNELAAGR